MSSFTPDSHNTDVSKLEDLVAKAVVDGIEPSGPVTVVSADWHGDQAITLYYHNLDNKLDNKLLYRSDEGIFSVREGTYQSWSFDGDGHLFRLATEAYRIRLAYIFDPYLALTSSKVDPLPHQIEAVYKDMLPRQPLRFLLADDPGAGKTIMAGLYLKELMTRGDAERILVVTPGALSVQWQDELYNKFGLDFEIVTKHDLDSINTHNVFERKPLLIARIDQLARRQEELEPALKQADWDLVIVDEAHRMSAHYFGSEVRKTKRYQLGERLGSATRHFLLMTATPHAGKEEDFNLFLALLDSDRFEGRFRDSVHSVDHSYLMRRMVKETLLTFDGRRLFPERRAKTVKYKLSDEEMTLYDEVTEYVREQMNRVDRLTDAGQGRRGNMVGFALTMLQRRLASSPEAIYKSLYHRRKRLEKQIIEEKSRARAATFGMTPQEERLSVLLSDENIDHDSFDFSALDDLDSKEQEELETEVVIASTAAATISELRIEIETLKQLEELAYRLRDKSVDAKWGQLSSLLSTEQAMFMPDGSRRKLIIFTEHRDTMKYLVDRLRAFFDDASSVAYISGSTSRKDRSDIQVSFNQDETCIVLVATDAAGEGIDLQRAHLVINYDLPWNPNRIEQRFGRVHRIGQTEMCYLWNLVAEDTREAHVYLRLLDKIEQQRIAYKGQVFDVLGEALSGAELRELLLEAIRYGDDPKVRGRINQVIDETVGQRIRDAIEHPPLTTEIMAFVDVERIRMEMQEASVHRLQPHYICSFFEAALIHLGGKLIEREPGRYQITNVPQSIRQHDLQIGIGEPVYARYERITFEKELVHQVGVPIAELLSPGHPLLEATIDLTLERHRNLFNRGTVLVDDADKGDQLRVLIILEHSIIDGRYTRNQPHTVVSKRFEFVEISGNQAVTSGYAPYLDYRPPSGDESIHIDSIFESDWIDTDLETIGLNHAINFAVPEHLAQVRAHTKDRVHATLDAVKKRLTYEINYWNHRAKELQLKADTGKTPQMNPDRAQKRAEDLALRLEHRVNELNAELNLHALPPVVVGGALVVPAGLLNHLVGTPEPAESVISLAEVEHRAIQAVLVAENHLGWEAVDLSQEHHNHPGYDIRSWRPRRDYEPGDLKFIKVKGRTAGVRTVTISRNEILTSLNNPDNFVLALVEISLNSTDTVRYLQRPFEGHSDKLAFDIASVNFDWDTLWHQGEAPS